MASSSSNSFETIHGLGSFKKLNDAVFEVYKPATGAVDLELVFFHGFQSQDYRNAYVKTWMVADGSACWLNSWLPETFPRSRILSVSYDSSTTVTESSGRMDMYIVGENLAKSIIELAGVGQTFPVVLVGHCVGGMVLKEVCRRADRLKAQGSGINPYETFLSRMKGAFFYSTPQMGSRIKASSKAQGPLVEYFKLLSNDGGRLNAEFSQLRTRDEYRWKTFGISEANATEHDKTIVRKTNCRRQRIGRKCQHEPVVEESSARCDMDEFCVLEGEDNTTVCKPKNRSSSSFQLLVKFVQGILDSEERAMKLWPVALEFPQLFKSRPDRVKEVIKLLQLDQPEPSRVSLIGMGGIGKSTLAKEILVEIRSQFDLVCFVEDVKGRLEHHNLHSLVARNLYHGNGLRKVRMLNDDAESLWLLLREKKVLLILDNAVRTEVIGNLFASNWIGKGSRLIITSRERPHGSFVMYKVPFFSRKESKSFFLAQMDVDAVREIPDELIDRVVEKCDGLPLTLEVTGSYLHGVTDVRIWNETLESLKRAESVDGSTDDRLWAKLRVSFDHLGDRERRMFLDLAMFDKCHGFQYDLNIWKAVWGAELVSIGLMNLENKCFIRTTEEHNEFRSKGTFDYVTLLERPTFVYIHEQLRDMGRSIARSSHETIELGRGVWQDDYEDNLLEANERENDQTEALSVTWKQCATTGLGRPYRWSSVRQVQNLRLLRMYNVRLCGDGDQRFPPKLVLLHLDSCFRTKAEGHLGLLESECWPIRAKDVEGIEALRVLILENCLLGLLPDNFHRLRNLRILKISGESFTEFPENFGRLPSLEILVVVRAGLSKLPDSFHQLSSLQSFTMIDCPAFQSLGDWSVRRPHDREASARLPRSMLESIRLIDLPGLKTLPKTLGQLSGLKKLSIVRCSAVSSLPKSLGHLMSLQRLEIRGCGALLTLPESLGYLGSLQILIIVGCHGLLTLPESLGHLMSLQYLEIWRCGALLTLPESLGYLGSLQSLMIRQCCGLLTLPESLGYLGSLQILIIVGCHGLLTLPESFGHLKSLQKLEIRRCLGLLTLPESFGHLKSLQHLEICRYGDGAPWTLQRSFGHLKSLQHLEIRRYGDGALWTLQKSFGYLKSLQNLEIRRSGGLLTLPESFGHLKSLQHLEIRGCDSLLILPESFGHLKSLQHLEICGGLLTLPESFWHLKSLQHLKICGGLLTLPVSFGHLKSLQHLKIHRSGSLTLLENFGYGRRLTLLENFGHRRRCHRR